jgi:hypothetical protein
MSERGMNENVRGGRERMMRVREEEEGEEEEGEGGGRGV